jgi:ribosomal protein L20
LRRRWVAYRDRRCASANFKLWIIRIGAAARENGMKLNNSSRPESGRIDLDRKVLADIAPQDPATQTGRDSQESGQRLTVLWDLGPTDVI